MGFSLKKAFKSVTKPIATVVNSVGKIASGNVAEGLGDIGQAAVRTGLDTVTLGNKSTVDGLSGGLLTAGEQAARGNTKDIVRVGAVAGATVYGGPMAGMAVNSALAGGANILQAGMAGAMNSSGGEMSFLSDVGGFLNNNPGISQLANNVISGLGPKSAPKVVQAAPAVQYIETPAKGMSQGMLMGVGAAVVAVALLAVVLLRRKGK